MLKGVILLALLVGSAWAQGTRSREVVATRTVTEEESPGEEIVTGYQLVPLEDEVTTNEERTETVTTTEEEEGGDAGRRVVVLGGGGARRAGRRQIITRTVSSADDGDDGRRVVVLGGGGGRTGRRRVIQTTRTVSGSDGEDQDGVIVLGGAGGNARREVIETSRTSNAQEGGEDGVILLSGGDAANRRRVITETTRTASNAGEDRVVRVIGGRRDVGGVKSGASSDGSGTAIGIARGGVEDNPEPEPYNFEFSAESAGGLSTRQESQDAQGRIVGFYTITGDDGRERRVDYVADENGFRATVQSNEIGMENSKPAGVEVLAAAPSEEQRRQSELYLTTQKEVVVQRAPETRQVTREVVVDRVPETRTVVQRVPEQREVVVERVTGNDRRFRPITISGGSREVVTEERPLRRRVILGAGGGTKTARRTIYVDENGQEINLDGGAGSAGAAASSAGAASSSSAAASSSGAAASVK